ncbi:MAG: serine--tRNA ligase, partial [Deltaproteobacteria bacterium]|nr:serine--tRNA ligase [Deltaproteobacteria bacterium]
MIDLNELRSNPELYREACRRKRIKFDVDAFLELDARHRELKTKIESLRAVQNACSKEIPKLSGADKEAKLAEMKGVASELKESAESFKQIEAEWSRLQLFLPSVP